MKFVKSSRISESQIQGMFYYQCQLAGIDVYLGYQICAVHGIYARTWSVFDAVVLCEKDIVAIVEVKKREKNELERQIWAVRRQGTKYMSFGVPVILLCGVSDIVPTINKLKKLIDIYKKVKCIAERNGYAGGEREMSAKCV